MSIELMQFSAMLIMALLMVKLLMLPQRTITSPVVQKTRWLLLAGTILLGIHFFLQYKLGLRTRGITLAVMLNIAFFIPCSACFSLAILNLLSRGRLNEVEKYISIPVWLIAMAVLFIDRNNLLWAESIATILYAGMQIYYTIREMRYIRHIQEILSDYFDTDKGYMLRWVEWSIYLLMLMALMVPVIIYGHDLLLILFALLFFFGIFYLVDSFCLFVVSNAPDQVVEAETETEQHDTGLRMSDNAMLRVDAAVSRWIALQGHLKAGLNMPSAAEEMGVPRYLLSAWFKQKGIHYSDWLANLRITEAKQLIREHPDWSNETVAQHCGFSDRTYFQRKFKEITGMTPNDFLKQ